MSAVDVPAVSRPSQSDVDTDEENELRPRPETAGRNESRRTYARVITVVLGLGALVVLPIIAVRFVYGRIPVAYGDFQPFAPSLALAEQALTNYWVNTSMGFPGSPLPYVFMEGGLSQLLASQGLAERLFPIGLVLSAALGSHAMFRGIGVRRSLATVGGFLYAWNPIPLAYAVIGSIPDSLVAYSLVPWLLLLVVRSQTSRRSWIPYACGTGILVSIGLDWNPQVLFWFLPVLLISIPLSSAASEVVIGWRRRFTAFTISGAVATSLNFFMVGDALVFLRAYFVTHTSSMATQILGPTAAGFAIDLTDNFLAQAPIAYAELLAGLAGVMALLAYVRPRYWGRDGRQPPRYRPAALLAILVLVSLLGLWMLIDQYGAPVALAQYAFFVGAYEPVAQLGLDVFLLLLVFILTIEQTPISVILQRVSDSFTLAFGYFFRAPVGTRKTHSKFSSMPDGLRRRGFSQSGDLRIQIVAISALVLTMSFLPSTMAGVPIPSLAAASISPPNLSAYAVPEGLAAADAWLVEHAPPIAGERAAWIPSDPQFGSFVGAMKNHYGVITFYEKTGWDQVFYPLVSFHPEAYHTMGKLLADMAVRYVVLPTNLTGGVFPQLHSGVPRLELFGWPWQLQYYPVGDPGAWWWILHNQTDLSQVYSDPYVRIFQVGEDMSPIIAYDTAAVPTAYLQVNIGEAAPNYCLSCLPFQPTGPLFLSSKNSIANANFSSGLPSWAVLDGAWNSSGEHGGSAVSHVSAGQYSVLAQTLNATAGIQVMTGWMRTASAGDSRVLVREKSSNGSLIGQASPETGIQGSSDWFQFGGLYDVPNGTARLDVYLIAQSGPNRDSTTWFSNVSLHPAYIPPQVPITLSSDVEGPTFHISIQSRGTFVVYLRMAADAGWICECPGRFAAGTVGDGLFVHPEWSFNATAGDKLAVAYAPSLARQATMQIDGGIWGGMTGLLLLVVYLGQRGVRFHSYSQTSQPRRSAKTARTGGFRRRVRD